MKNYISASILSADMLNLNNEVKRLEKSNVDMLHFDVMDGVFVNNITFGIPVLGCINKSTNMLLDVHLMITDPLKYIDAFADNGADIITFHLESESNTKETIEAIHKRGIKVGLAIKPNTPAELIYDYIPYIDMVLVMTVEPGFGGQKFISATVDKIVKIRKYIEQNKLSTDIQVDGGIDNITSKTVKNAGANILVSGSYLFKSSDMASAATEMKEVKLNA